MNTRRLAVATTGVLFLAAGLLPLRHCGGCPEVAVAALGQARPAVYRRDPDDDDPCDHTIVVRRFDDGVTYWACLDCDAEFVVVDDTAERVGDEVEARVGA